MHTFFFLQAQRGQAQTSHWILHIFAHPGRLCPLYRASKWDTANSWQWQQKKKKSNYLQYKKKWRKTQIITIYRYTITKIFALLAGAIKRWEALEKQMVRLTTNSVWGHPVNICSLWWAFNIWICEDDFLYASGINRIPCINLDSNAQLHSYKHSYVLNINKSIHENNCRVSGGNNCISYHIGQVRYKWHTC